MSFWTSITAHMGSLAEQQIGVELGDLDEAHRRVDRPEVRRHGAPRQCLDEQGKQRGLLAERRDHDLVRGAGHAGSYPEHATGAVASPRRDPHVIIRGGHDALVIRADARAQVR
jgi:hypothetical protein